MTTARGIEQPAKPSPDEAFGRTVHMVMFDKRVTQSQLAQQIGVDQSTLSKKLRGKRSWTLDEMISVADALRVDARDLLSSMWSDPGTPQAAERGDLTNPYLSVTSCLSENAGDNVIVGPWSIPSAA
jgi:transcriptional regulator with XRE-family HTH domain